jgi:hypothetical protein
MFLLSGCDNALSLTDLFTGGAPGNPANVRPSNGLAPTTPPSANPTGGGGGGAAGGTGGAVTSPIVIAPTPSTGGGLTSGGTGGTVPMP